MYSFLYCIGSENGSLKEEIRFLRSQILQLEDRLDSHGDKTGKSDRIIESIPSSLTGSINKDFYSNDNIGRMESFPVLKRYYDVIDIDGNVDIVGYYSDQNTVPGGSTAPGVKAVREDTSDIVIDQVRINFAYNITEYVDAFIGLQYEDYRTGNLAPIGSGGGVSDTDTSGDSLNVDEAYVSLKNRWGIYAKLGKQYMPFGNVEEYGNFINDSRARFFYETRETGGIFGIERRHMDFNIFTFNGQAEQVRHGGAGFGGSADNKLETWGSSLSYNILNDDMNLKVGVSYLNNLFQAQNTDAGAGIGSLNLPNTYKENDNGAINIYIVSSKGPFWMSAEYVSSLNNLDRDQDPFALGIVPAGDNEIGINGDTNIRPYAYTVEIGLTYPICDRDYTLSLKYEATNDLEDFPAAIGSVNFPVQDIWGVGLATDLYPNTQLTLNYENWDYVDIVSGPGGGGHANIYMTELSIKF